MGGNVEAEVLIDRLLNLMPCQDLILAAADRARERARSAEIVQSLPGGVPQRTPEWYEVRKGMITASEFKMAAADTIDTYVWGKIFPQPFPSNAAMQWGCRFEDLAAATYERENHVKIHEYGLLVHPQDHWLGASPDGITEYGVAIEIKCPYSRKRCEIDKRVAEKRPFPKNDKQALHARYLPQIQGQLEVCNLDVCDFVVAHIDAMDADTFWQLRRVSDQPYRYAIVADVPKEGGEPGALAYRTAPLNLDDTALEAWKEGVCAAGAIEIHYAHVRELGVTRIRRDKHKWSEIRHGLGRSKAAIEAIKQDIDHTLQMPPGCNVPMFSADCDEPC